MMLLDGLEPEEFDLLMERFIDREDPNAMSFEALDQAACLQLAEVTTAQVSGNHSLMGKACQLPCRDYGGTPG